MALLSATEGTPERVWSLISILSAHGGDMLRPDLVQWLNPPFRSGTVETQEKKTAVDATIQVASDLGLIDTGERGKVRLAEPNIPGSYIKFSDLVHGKLAALPDAAVDSIVLEAFAWLAVRVETEGSTLWISEWGADEFADDAEKALNPAGGERRFNTTKRAPWRRWMEFLGLAALLPTPPGSDYYPYVTCRLERELFRGDLPLNEEIAAREFLEYIAARLPYLDGGRWFMRLCERLNHQMPPQRLSRLLSAALRELQEDRRVTLVARGDARDAVELASDQFSRPQSFAAAILSTTEEYNG